MLSIPNRPDRVINCYNFFLNLYYGVFYGTVVGDWIDFHIEPSPTNIHKIICTMNILGYSGSDQREIIAVFQFAELENGEIVPVQVDGFREGDVN